MKITVALALLLSFNAAAAEVVKFKPRPAVVEQDGSSYVGILMSEEDFRTMLQKKIDTNAKMAECQVDKKVCTQMQETYKLSITKLEQQLRKNELSILILLVSMPQYINLLRKIQQQILLTNHIFLITIIMIYP